MLTIMTSKRARKLQELEERVSLIETAMPAFASHVGNDVGAVRRAAAILLSRIEKLEKKQGDFVSFDLILLKLLCAFVPEQAKPVDAEFTEVSSLAIPVSEST